MLIGVPRESREAETRVAVSPEVIKRLIKKGFEVSFEKGAGSRAGFLDSDYLAAGAKAALLNEALDAPIIFKVNRPDQNEILKMRPGSLLVGYLEPYKKDGFFEKLAESKIDSIAMELIPRTSRAQSIDALSSQANIAGYRAVIEAARVYGGFLPMMMTAAGSAKPARVAVLGVGVAGLQAISTAKRLGAVVEVYDVRPEVNEQIISVGAKVIDLDIGEQGSGAGGYAKELSAEAKKRQQDLLTEKLKKFDIIITTANIPGRQSPTLVTEEAVLGMKAGSVIIDMAAANGGNCPLTVADQTLNKNGVTIVGITNYAALMPSVASHFFGMNLYNLACLLIPEKPISEKAIAKDAIIGGAPTDRPSVTGRQGHSPSAELAKLKGTAPNAEPSRVTLDTISLNLEDDIIAASLVTHNGQYRLRGV